MTSASGGPGLAEGRLLAEQRVGQQEAEGDGLPGAGAGGDEQVAPAQAGGQHLLLHGGGLVVAAGVEGAPQRRVDFEGSEAHGRIYHGSRSSSPESRSHSA